MKKILSTIVVVWFVCTSVAAQTTDNHNHAAGEKCEATIHGHVVDTHTQKHIPYITVTIDNTTIGTTTDATGHYTLYHVPVGKFKVSISAIGYNNQSKEIEVVCGSDIQLNFETTESQVSLDAVVVSSNRNETTRRAAPALVNIVVPEIFDKVSAPTLAEGLSFQPGVRVENSCQNCGFAQVRINGLDGQYSQILINSRPIFSALAGYMAWSISPQIWSSAWRWYEVVARLFSARRLSAERLISSPKSLCVIRESYHTR